MNGTYHGPESIDIGRVEHMRTVDMYDMVEEREGVSEITDECAATIAALWQAPRGHGVHFAELASTGRVMLEHLCDDLSHLFDQRDLIDPKDYTALCMLATWAINHPSRAVRHADYPHLPGMLHDCPACEMGPCTCPPGSWCVSRDCHTDPTD